MCYLFTDRAVAVRKIKVNGHRGDSSRRALSCLTGRSKCFDVAGARPSSTMLRSRVSWVVLFHRAGALRHVAQNSKASFLCVCSFNFRLQKLCVLWSWGCVSFFTTSPSPSFFSLEMWTHTVGFEPRVFSWQDKQHVVLRCFCRSIMIIIVAHCLILPRSSSSSLIHDILRTWWKSALTTICVFGGANVPPYKIKLSCAFWIIGF